MRITVIVLVVVLLHVRGRGVLFVLLRAIVVKGLAFPAAALSASAG